MFWNSLLSNGHKDEDEATCRDHDLVQIHESKSYQLIMLQHLYHRSSSLL